MAKYHEDTEVAGHLLLSAATGATLATFSSFGAAKHAMNMLREGNLVSAKWHNIGPTTAGDRTTFDALAKLA